eukprot:CAMPEP_0115477542 /NCGR_PEP_ID=MMETSP0271-20121206/55729_1 /TAXON_ID=71861 /ORGANISM="Scrippsiella trochoidea, Strain CCMP3099" /LENGTH=136 /DNA_ID=CAMNT_0002905035 /DNA_START=1264 /DNA_END=1675 /DNA_ORIENTATION=-
MTSDVLWAAPLRDPNGQVHVEVWICVQAPFRMAHLLDVISSASVSSISLQTEHVARCVSTRGAQATMDCIALRLAVLSDDCLGMRLRTEQKCRGKTHLTPRPPLNVALHDDILHDPVLDPSVLGITPHVDRIAYQK